MSTSKQQEVVGRADEEDAVCLVCDDDSITLDAEAYDALLSVTDNPMPSETTELLSRKAVWE